MLNVIALNVSLTLDDVTIVEIVYMDRNLMSRNTKQIIFLKLNSDIN